MAKKPQCLACWRPALENGLCGDHTDELLALTIKAMPLKPAEIVWVDRRGAVVEQAVV